MRIGDFEGPVPSLEDFEDEMAQSFLDAFDMINEHPDSLALCVHYESTGQLAYDLRVLFANH